MSFLKIDTLAPAIAMSNKLPFVSDPGALCLLPTSVIQYLFGQLVSFQILTLGIANNYSNKLTALVANVFL